MSLAAVFNVQIGVPYRWVWLMYLQAYLFKTANLLSSFICTQIVLDSLGVLVINDMNCHHWDHSSPSPPFLSRLMDNRVWQPGAGDLNKFRGLCSGIVYYSVVYPVSCTEIHAHCVPPHPNIEPRLRNILCPTPNICPTPHDGHRSHASSLLCILPLSLHFIFNPPSLLPPSLSPRTRERTEPHWHRKAAGCSGSGGFGLCDW